MTVSIVNSHGSDAVEDGFLFSPGLSQLAPARVGGTLALGLAVDPLNLYVTFFGTPGPTGFGILVPPLCGSLALLPDFQVLESADISASGKETFAYPIPSNPALAGLELGLQGIALSSLDPLNGCFTNLLTVVIKS